METAKRPESDIQGIVSSPVEVAMEALAPRGRFSAALPGLAVCAAVALLSMELGRLPALPSLGLSALTLAVLLGMVLGNTVFPGAAAVCADGVDFTKHFLLRTGIVLYGFRLTFTDVAQVGLPGIGAGVLMVASTLALGLWVGTRVLKLDRTTALLIGAGAAICGAAAVLAVAALVKAKSAQATVAVATVVLFGTIAMLLYPLIHQPMAAAFAGNPGSYGVYIGSTVHEVAQAIAAGSMFDTATANAALVTKLVRVALLGPVLLVLSAWEARKQSSGVGVRRTAIPWFAFGFLGAAAVNSFVPLPATLLLALNYSGSLFLGMAMAALGLGAQWPVMRRAGGRPLFLALVLACWLLAGGLCINLFLSHGY